MAIFRTWMSEENLTFSQAFFVPEVHPIRASSICCQLDRLTLPDLWLPSTAVAVECVIEKRCLAFYVLVEAGIIVETGLSIHILSDIVHLAIPLEVADRSVG